MLLLSFWETVLCVLIAMLIVFIVVVGAILLTIFF